MKGAKLTAIDGAGNHADRAEQLLEAIIQAIEEKGEGMTYAAVIGTLEIAKMLAFQEASE